MAFNNDKWISKETRQWGVMCAVFVDSCITVCITSAQGFGSGASQCMIHNFTCLFPFPDKSLTTTTPKVHILIEYALNWIWRRVYWKMKHEKMSDWVYYGCQAMQKRNVKESIQFTVKSHHKMEANKDVCIHAKRNGGTVIENPRP